MNLLAFDTSGPVMSVALKCGSSSPAEKIHSGSWGHMEKLLPFIDEVLREEKIQLDKIDAFLINRGPGSFTGLRIGFSTLLGLTAELPKPCFGADSLDLLAQRIACDGQHAHLAVCLDAFRSQFYIKLFENHQGEWRSQDSSRAVETEKAIQMIPPGTIVTGNALERYQSRFEASPAKLTIAEKNLWYPRASALIDLYEKHSPALKKLVSSEDFLPAYLRLSEPEERRNERKL